MVIKFIRRNVGVFVAGLGFFLLCIFTFGDIGQIETAEYWRNVYNNLTAIGFMSICLTAIQTIVKQGLGEQALQRGMNTPTTIQRKEEHADLVRKCQSKSVVLPYFLQTYNKKQTQSKRREFLINNNFVSEQALMVSGTKRQIRQYNKIRVCYSASRIKWSTSEVVYDKKGRIITLTEYRRRRAVIGTIQGLLGMIAMTFFTRGLFWTEHGFDFWSSFWKLVSYVLVIAVTSIFGMLRDYEKGAFGVARELEEINGIWQEFYDWEVPKWVVKEIKELNDSKISLEANNGEHTECEKTEATADGGADVPKEQAQSEVVPNPVTSHVLSSADSGTDLRSADGTELSRERDGNTRLVGQGQV